MTTLVLDDDLINKVVQLGNYQTQQEAVAAILSEYVQTNQAKNALFDKAYLDADMADGEIDSLFERDKDVGEI
ncbi:MAG: type II toxin-antitoxin system VapB family antitoxin [Methylococcales bacterium]|nr:type II toxin-antitoxin system VapB family antitoxin [Methylococcales bacterium]